MEKLSSLFLVNHQIKFTFYCTNLTQAKHELSEPAIEPKLLYFTLNDSLPKCLMDIQKFSVQYGLSKGLVFICCIKDCGTAESDFFNCSTVQKLGPLKLLFILETFKKNDNFFIQIYLVILIHKSVYMLGFSWFFKGSFKRTKIGQLIQLKTNVIV